MRPLSGVARGLFWVILSGAVFVVFIVIVRLVGTSLNPVQVAFLRYGISVILLVPMVYRQGVAVLYTRRPVRHAMRGGVHALGVLLWFYAITRIPIAEATALSYTAPIFVIIGAAIFLDERLGLGTLAAVVGAFLGVLLIVQPGVVSIGSGSIAMLCSAPLFAASKLLVKTLVREDSSVTTVIYLSLFATLTMMIPAIMVWRSPTLLDLGLLSVAAVFATLSHLFLAQGLKFVDVSVAQPAEFLRLVWAATLGFLLFDETPGFWVWIGSLVVVASVSFAANMELKRAYGRRS
ncbi:MAG: DMT family transporter [Proteobacteria bacterium]|nr:MAG: DMT family transporter [Pseudomonadota bacterium]